MTRALRVPSVSLRTRQWYWCLSVWCLWLLVWLLATCWAQGAWAQGAPIRRVPLVRFVSFSQNPRQVPQGQTATYTVRLRFQLSTTSFALQARVVYYDSGNNEYIGESNTITLQLDTDYYQRVRVAVPIPRGYSYVSGSLRYDGVAITPSSVGNAAVYCWVDVRADNQDHTVSMAILRN